MNFGSDYAATDDKVFVAKYRARCKCGTVCYDSMFKFLELDNLS